MKAQDFFNKACNSLRANGNPYGSTYERHWGYTNPDNPSQKCALASFCGDMDGVLKAISESDSPTTAQLVHNKIVCLFDCYPEICNDRIKLEICLKDIADRLDLRYTLEIPEFEKELTV